MNKKGAFTDLFIFMILSFAIILICAIFIFVGGKANEKLHEKLDNQVFGDKNGTLIVDQTIGKVNQSYQALYWISVFLIFGMIISIFIGSYLVTTKPIFFIPYIFIVIIAIIVSVVMSNAYEQLILDPTMATIFNNMFLANFVMSKLPIWITIIGFTGGIIMYSRIGSRENQIYGGYYG